MQNYIERIGHNLRKARFGKGLSLKELSKLAGIGPGHISMIENGQRKHLQARTVQKLAKGLGVDVAVLMDEGRDTVE